MPDQTLQQQLQGLEKLLSDYYRLSQKARLDEATQRRVVQVELAANKLRQHLQSAPVATAAPPPTSNIQQDPAEAAEACAAIDAYAREDTPEDVFLEISKAEFVEALKIRVSNPKDVDQNQLNLCGAASFMVLWIERDPRGFTRAAIELFQTGKSTYKDIKIKANKSMFENDEVRSGKYSLQLVDWLVLSSLQNASGLLGYNPDKEMGGVRGIGLPGKVLKWFEKLSGGEAKKYKKDFKPSELNQLYKADNYILFLVNVNLLDDYFSDTRYQDPNDSFQQKKSAFFAGVTGNHYVVLNSPIRKEGDDLVLDLWTWGRTLEVRIPPRAFQKTVVQTFVVAPEQEGDDESPRA